MTSSSIEEDHNIVLVAHKFLTQPDDDLVLFLNREKSANVLHIRHSFSDAPDRCSYASWYRKGELVKQDRTRDFKGWGELFLYVKELYYTMKWVLATDSVRNIYIGMDGLCVLFGMILKRIGRVKKIVYWAIDFVPTQRFSSRWKNAIYHQVNVYGYKHADEMWDLGVRMAEAREKFLGIQKKDYRLHRVVPYGVWTDRIRKYCYEECERYTAVFMGHLLEKQGVQLVIAALPDLIKKIPNFRFKIIGAGPYKESLICLARELNVLPYCDFQGKIDDIRELENEVAKSSVAVAPYVKKLDTWSYYADPGKIKTYLACGVPVLLTEIPWNAQEITSNRCGLIISEDKNDIAEKLSALMRADANREYRKNAIAYAKKFDYGNIFARLNV